MCSNEIQRALLNKKEESNERPEHKEEIKIRRKMQEETLRQRFEAEKKRKKEEVQKIKDAIKSTMLMSSSIKANILSEKREKVREMSFVLDDTTSSIISIPSNLSTRLKTATRYVCS
jgi:GH18 family chitinase